MTRGFLVFTLGIAVACVAGYFQFTKKKEVLPVFALQAYAAQEELELKNATDVPLDEYASFSGIGCVATPTLEQAANELRQLLSDVPHNISTRIVKKALPTSTGECSARYENDFTVNGKLTYILAFWHTVVSEGQVKSCISLAGGYMKPASRIVGTTVKKVQTTTGYTRCNCKFATYFCGTCPLLEQSEESVSVTVPVRWSARQHKQMQNVFRKQSVTMIQSLSPQTASGVLLPVEYLDEASTVRDRTGL